MAKLKIHSIKRNKNGTVTLLLTESKKKNPKDYYDMTPAQQRRVDKREDRRELMRRKREDRKIATEQKRHEAWERGHRSKSKRRNSAKTTPKAKKKSKKSR